ncbi:uncharacterized protein APUU_80963A [Aspergillus puulaauensis]|uniref:Uncharacterized protein n=1 Tax=Aspergillus puulaauensis TaxID=1220207 RepID=A0A7R7XZM8_9EURO|nr:uncharacterized protein APUU_80963A [Aspergillus puulaauensis]BCS30660.1 hypothetical protein APUU_80963A [Aspergillus puulaauensis]
MERLSKLDTDNDDAAETLDLTRTLIMTGIKSASKTLQIISQNDSLLEVFLLYNLEFTYAAAIHLAMASALSPEAFDGKASAQEAHSILDQMISNGNKVARVRKEELLHLEGLFHEVAARAESKGLQPLSLTTALGREVDPDEHGFRVGTEEQHLRQLSDDMLPDAHGDPEYDHSMYHGDVLMPSTELLNDIGISSVEFLGIIEQIGNPDTGYSLLDLGQ